MDNDLKIIDPDEEIPNQKDTYQQVVLRQMQRCVDNLSKEVTAGHFKQKHTKTGGVVEVWQEDVRHLIINSVNTFMGLMQPFIEDDYQEELTDVFEEIDNFKLELGKRTIHFKGKGQVKVSELHIIPPQTIVYQELLEFKAEKYREVFNILILIYNKYKEAIKEYEEE